MSNRVQRNIRAALLFIAVFFTALPFLSRGDSVVGNYLPDNQRMETFGQYRDGTLSSIIAISAIVCMFLQSAIRERTNLAIAKERSDETKQESRAMAEFATTIKTAMENQQLHTESAVRDLGKTIVESIKSVLDTQHGVIK